LSCFKCVFFVIIYKYDDFFDGDDDLLYLTQVAEIETKMAQSNNVVDSKSLQTFNTLQHNTEVNKTTFSVPMNTNIETIRKPTPSTKQTKLTNMLGSSTSTTSCSSIAEPTRLQNDWKSQNNDIANSQMSGKRIASSPIHDETKRSLVEIYNPEDIWNDIDMDVNVSTPLVKILSSTTIIKNSKIQVKQNKWICSGIVIDQTKEIEVEFSSEVSYKTSIYLYIYKGFNK